MTQYWGPLMTQYWGPMIIQYWEPTIIQDWEPMMTQYWEYGDIQQNSKRTKKHEMQYIEPNRGPQR